MVVPHHEHRISYERALRVIGRHLDWEPAYHPSILEVPDGFTVRSQPVRHRTAGRVENFDWVRLSSLDVLHSAARHIGRRRVKHQGMWGAMQNGHENFFRALGFILDRDGASSVSIDELPNSLAVSYMRPAPGDPRFFEKCHVLYEQPDIEAVLQEARGRRGQRRATA